MLSRKSLQALVALAVSTLVLACSDGPSGPGVRAPTITISGISEGGSYAAPIAVDISVDRGTFTATLNNAPYTSGTVINQSGAYTLVVSARDGSATSNVTMHFNVTGSTAVTGLTTIRLINLGSNDSGGGGDAILITDSTNGRVASALADAGPAGTGGGDFSYVANRIRAMGIDSLEFVMLTHAHGDHYLGIPAVFNLLRVKRFIYNGQARNLTSYQNVIAAARTEVGNDSVIVPTAVRAMRLGHDSAAALLTVIPPLPTYLSPATDDGDLLNEGSLGMQLKRGIFEMFFTGDGEVEATRRWRLSFAAYTQAIDVLKVGHHGANNAIFDNGFNGISTWLMHTDPQTAVISANGTTHPRLNALNALLTRTNMRTYCTNVHGDIAIRVAADGSYTVTAERNANQTCVAGSQATT